MKDVQKLADAVKALGDGVEKLSTRMDASFDVAQLKAQQAILEQAHKEAGQRLKAMSGGGLMGLTPDDVKNSPKWKDAKADYESAFARLRKFNEQYVKVIRGK